MNFASRTKTYESTDNISCDRMFWNFVCKWQRASTRVRPLNVLEIFDVFGVGVESSNIYTFYLWWTPQATSAASLRMKNAQTRTFIQLNFRLKLLSSLESPRELRRDLMTCETLTLNAWTFPPKMYIRHFHLARLWCMVQQVVDENFEKLDHQMGDRSLVIDTLLGYNCAIALNHPVINICFDFSLSDVISETCFVVIFSCVARAITAVQLWVGFISDVRVWFLKFRLD